MAARGPGYRKTKRSGRTVLVIDFTYKNAAGKWCRYRRDASVQTATAARAEADRLRRLAAETGSPNESTSSDEEEQPQPVLTFAQFVEGIWSKAWKPNFAPSTQERYQYLLSQGILEHFGELPLDQISGMDMRRYNANLAVRNVQVKPHQSFVSSILKAAVEAGVLEEFPKNWPKHPKQKKSSPESRRTKRWKRSSNERRAG